MFILINQESRIPFWRVELKILDGEVDWWTESEAQPGGYYQHVYQMDKVKHTDTLLLGTYFLPGP